MIKKALYALFFALILTNLAIADQEREVFVSDTDWDVPENVEEVEVLVVGGGGSGGGPDSYGGGGGGGGVVYDESYDVVPGEEISIEVGDGAEIDETPAESSKFDNLEAIGGGMGGASGDWGSGAGEGGFDGGSGGGGDWYAEGGDPLQPGTNEASDYGNEGGEGDRRALGGGGGANERGEDAASEDYGGDGGEGVYYGNIFGDDVGQSGYFGGGGGGGCRDSCSTGPGDGGIGGGGDGGWESCDADDGLANTGGGGGGEYRGCSGEGGSGVVIVQYDTSEPPNEPTNPDPEDGEEEVSVDTKLSVDVADPDGDDMDVKFEVDGETYTDDNVCSGCTAEVDIHELEEDESYSWTAKASNDGGSAEGGPWSFSTFESPEITDLNFDDSNDEHAFVLEADFDEGSSDVNSCEVEAEHDGDTESYTGDIDGEVCEVDRIEYDNNDGWEDEHDSDKNLVELDIEVEIEDQNDLSDTETGSHSFPNNPPVISEPSPEDGSIWGSETAVLNITGEDPDGADEELTAYFYDDSNNEFLGKHEMDYTQSSPTDQGTYYSEEIDDISVGDSVEWNVDLSDGHENTTRSFSFVRTLGENYRIAPEVNMDYSSFILGTGEVRDFFLTVEESSGNERDIDIILEGVNATFLENNEKVLSYQLDEMEEIERLVRINSEEEYDGYLNVTVRDNDINMNRTESVPVLVEDRDSVSEVRQVSGLQFIHLLFLGLASAFLYFSLL